ncbi:hypothetical protein [Ramlibacter sp.]|uniref:hypothetical protein n=1 Tax=Ramlibacter sp. TaxID=1917967 RepID=UPI003D144842
MKTRLVAQYGVLSHYPRPHLTEHVHIGLVCFLATGEVRVHFADDLRKLRAIDTTVDMDAVRSWETGLPRLVANMSVAEATAFIRDFGQWGVSGELGRFAYADEDEYAQRVSHAMRNLVAAPSNSPRDRSEVSRLHVDLKIAFSAKGWLGRDIRNHEIVERYPLGPMTTAEFALENGRLHVIETLDLRRSNLSAKRSDARSKALTLDMARRKSGDSARYAVVAGRESPLLPEARDLLSDYCQSVLQWESVADMNALFEQLAEATGKPGLPLPL